MVLGAPATTWTADCPYTNITSPFCTDNKGGKSTNKSPRRNTTRSLPSLSTGTQKMIQSQRELYEVIVIIHQLRRATECLLLAPPSHKAAWNNLHYPHRRTKSTFTVTTHIAVEVQWADGWLSCHRSSLAFGCMSIAWTGPWPHWNKQVNHRDVAVHTWDTKKLVSHGEMFDSQTTSFLI